MVFADGSELQTDMIVFSAGIRPRDDIARDCGLVVGDRGGIVVNEACQTSDPDIHAIGECALYENRIYGLVAPGYTMATVAADHLCEPESNQFTGADMSTKLKLLGVPLLRWTFVLIISPYFQRGTWVSGFGKFTLLQ